MRQMGVMSRAQRAIVLAGDRGVAASEAQRLLQRFVDQGAAMTNAAFCPPKPNEFESTV